MDEPATNTPAPAAPSGITHPDLRGLAEAVSKGQGPSAPAAPGGQPNQPTTQEVEIDDGGVKRRVPVTEIQKVWAQKASLDQQARALEERFRQAGQDESLRALRNQLEQLPPSRRAKIAALMAGEDDGDDGGQDPTERLIRSSLGATDDDPQPQQRLPREFEELRNVVYSLAHEANQRHQETRRQTMGQQVDKLMAEYPVFRGEKAAASFAKDSVMSAIAANPQADMESLVRSAAARLQELQAPRPETSEVRRGFPSAALNGVRPNAEAMKRGDIRKAALSFLRSQGL